jgi:hypothetical protein
LEQLVFDVSPTCGNLSNETVQFGHGLVGSDARIKGLHIFQKSSDRKSEQHFRDV